MWFASIKLTGNTNKTDIFYHKQKAIAEYVSMVPVADNPY